MSHRRGAVVRVSVSLGVAALAAAAFVINAHAAPGGDAKAGADMFDQECSDCHSVKQGKNKKGPSLFGVVGRKSASIEDFVYSDAMKSANVVWTVEKIDAYITKPKEVVVGTKMKYDGLADATARANLLAFLAAQK